jgi:RNA polymerase sigma-70 factor (ECF subfamily)
LGLSRSRTLAFSATRRENGTARPQWRQKNEEPTTAQISPEQEQVTSIVGELAAGDPRQAPELARLVYDNLRRYAARVMGDAPRTLEPTALVNEAYLRLVDQNRVDWQGRTHFFAVVAGMIRRVLVDDARRRATQKRGGDRQRLVLEDGDLGSEPAVDLLALDDALAKLAALDPRAARVVELKFFGGLREADVAAALGVSPSTVRDDWRMARAWLRDELGEDAGDSSEQATGSGGSSDAQR